MTRLKKTTIALLAVLSMASLLFPGVRSLRKLNYILPESSLELVDGTYVESMRTDFEREISLRDRAVSFWSLIKYRLFNEGSPGVLIGEDNWLFTTEEFDEQTELTPEYAEFFRKVTEADRFFRQEEITLTVMIVPSKSRIYGNRIKRFGTPEAVERRYSQTVAELKKRGISVIDLEKTFLERKDQMSLFYRFDTHWTGEGTMTAAGKVADFLSSRGGLFSENSDRFRITENEEKAFSGDLLSFVPDLKKSIENSQSEEIYSRIGLTDTDPPELGLFDSPEIPVVLVGTSYSFDPRWNFENALKLKLQTDVLNLAEEGKGPFVPMEELMSEVYFREIGTRFILWEIPERYIPLRP